MTTDKVDASSKHFPYLKHSLTIEGIDVNVARRIARLKRKLSLKLDECLILHEEMMEFINSIDDSELRQILSLRYVNGLPWRQVAASIGYADESVPRKRCDRFLKENVNDRNIRNDVC